MIILYKLLLNQMWCLLQHIKRMGMSSVYTKTIINDLIMERWSENISNYSIGFLLHWHFLFLIVMHRYKFSLLYRGGVQASTSQRQSIASLDAKRGLTTGRLSMKYVKLQWSCLLGVWCCKSYMGATREAYTLRAGGGIGSLWFRSKCPSHQALP